MSLSSQIIWWMLGPHPLCNLCGTIWRKTGEFHTKTICDCKLQHAVMQMIPFSLILGNLTNSPDIHWSWAHCLPVRNNPRRKVSAQKDIQVNCASASSDCNKSSQTQCNTASRDTHPTNSALSLPASLQHKMHVRAHLAASTLFFLVGQRRERARRVERGRFDRQ